MLPTHRYGGSWSGFLGPWPSLVQQQRSLLPSIAGHPCRHNRQSSILCTLLETCSHHPCRRTKYSIASPLSKHAATPPPHPLNPLSTPSPPLLISRAGPRRLVSVFCDDPLLCNAGISSLQHVPVTCIQPHSSFPALLHLATCVVRPSVCSFVGA